MNKKSQTDYGNVSPILIVGIIVFVLPFFSHIIKMNIPGWVSGIGIFLILVGAGHSILKGMNRI
jgi:protein-S-isoprenylcysteine O-methyltransferase Ste14